MLDPQPTLVQGLIRQLLRQLQLRAPRFLRRHEDLDLRQREREEAQILQQLTPGRQRIGCDLGDALVVDAAAVGLAQKEDRERGIDE